MRVNCRWMMRVSALCGVSLFLTAIYSCGGVVAPARGDPGGALSSYGNYPDKTFWARDYGANRSSYHVNAQLLAEGIKCVVYAERGNRTVTPQVCQALARQYDSLIFGLITNHFGNIAYMPNNKYNGVNKVVLLLLDIKDNSATSSSYIAGLFDPTNMEIRSDSNALSMLYLDVVQQRPDSSGFYATVAHEGQHLINYSETIVKGRSAKETWLNEGLSTAAEYLYGIASGGIGDPNGRILAYNNAAVCPTLKDGNTFYVWGNRNDSLADYATSFLFFQWLRTHAAKESGNGYIFMDIMQQPNGSYEDIVNAVNAGARFFPVYPGSGMWTWEKLLRTWFLATALNEASGLHGYNAEVLFSSLSTEPKVTPGKTELTLYPGEGVFTVVGSGGFRPPVPDGFIHYASKDKTGAQSYQSGTRVVTYNANPATGGGMKPERLPRRLSSRDLPASPRLPQQRKAPPLRPA